MPTLQEILQQSQQRQQSQAAAQPQPPAGGQSQRLQDLLRAKSSGKQLTAGGPQMSTLAEKQAGVAGQQMLQQQRGQEQIQQQADVQQAAAQEQQIAGQEAQAAQRSQQIEAKHEDTLANLNEYFRQEGQKLDTAEAGEKMVQAVVAEELATKKRISDADIKSARERAVSAADFSEELSRKRTDALLSRVSDQEKFRTDEQGKEISHREMIAKMDAKDKIGALQDWRVRESKKLFWESALNIFGIGAEASSDPNRMTREQSDDTIRSSGEREVPTSEGGTYEQSGPAMESGRFST